MKKIFILILLISIITAAASPRAFSEGPTSSRTGIGFNVGISGLHTLFGIYGLATIVHYPKGSDYGFEIGGVSGYEEYIKNTITNTSSTTQRGSYFFVAVNKTLFNYDLFRSYVSLGLAYETVTFSTYQSTGSYLFPMLKLGAEVLWRTGPNLFIEVGYPFAFGLGYKWYW